MLEWEFRKSWMSIGIADWALRMSHKDLQLLDKDLPNRGEEFVSKNKGLLKLLRQRVWLKDAFQF